MASEYEIIASSALAVPFYTSPQVVEMHWASFQHSPLWEGRHMQTHSARHETVKTRFKKFASIGNGFVKSVNKRALFAHAIFYVVQVGIMVWEVNPFQ